MEKRKDCVGAMLQFYRTVPAVVFWQWFNQSFNALVRIKSNISSLVPTKENVDYGRGLREPASSSFLLALEHLPQRLYRNIDVLDSKYKISWGETRARPWGTYS